MRRLLTLILILIFAHQELPLMDEIEVPPLPLSDGLEAPQGSALPGLLPVQGSNLSSPDASGFTTGNANQTSVDRTANSEPQAR